MIWLLISIFCNAMMFVVLRSFSHFGVRSLPALVINYFTAGICTFFFPGTITVLLNAPEQPWFTAALGTGAVFISVFILVTRTANTLGIATASVANKMSFILPVLIGVFFFNEELFISRVIAFLLAMAAVVLVSIKRPETFPSGSAGKVSFPLLLGLVVFVGSGLVDAIISYMQQTFFMEGGFIPYVGLSFLSAGTIGAVALLIRREEPSLKEIRAGILLGIPNVASIVCMMAAIGEKLVDSGVLFAVCNMGVVILSTLSSIVFFRERLSALNWAGLALGVIAIAISAAR
ncbi:MAG: DMT family transporter [Bacteroidia bacterium]|nr:DMT family transporter [Bacteroidia bacterium]